MDRHYAQLMLNAMTEDIKKDLNKDLKKPFERLVKIVKITEIGAITFAPILCNN